MRWIERIRTFHAAQRGGAARVTQDWAYRCRVCGGIWPRESKLMAEQHKCKLINWSETK